MFLTTGQFTEKEQRTIPIKRLFRRIFLDDWPMKLIALIITIALYLGVSGETVTETFNDVPLRLRISDNAEFTNTPLQEVQIKLTGDKKKITDLYDEVITKRSGLIVSLDLTNEAIGDRVIDLTPDTVSIDLPAGVRLKEIVPNSILVRLEAVVEKDIPVKAETEGHVPEGSEVYGETVVVPQKVRVRGPASFMKTLEFVSTEKISLENRAGDFTAKQITVSVSNPKARLLNAVVDVIFHIREIPDKRVITALVKGDTPGKKIIITIEGASSVLKGIKPGDIKVEMIDNGSGVKVPQLVDLPAELQGKIEITKPKN